MATAICDGARGMYDRLEPDVRPSLSCFLDARGIVGDPPHVQRNALRRYKEMDKTRAGFNKDWGYMGCVKAARAHNNRAPTPQPQPRAAPITPQQRPTPRHAVITPPPIPYLAPAAASAADSDEAWLAKIRGAATLHEISALEALRARPLVARNEVFQLVARAVRETTTVPALVARATRRCYDETYAPRLGAPFREAMSESEVLGLLESAIGGGEAASALRDAVGLYANGGGDDEMT